MSAMRPYYVEYLYRDICLKFHTARSRTKHSVLLYNVIYKKSISQYFFFVLWNSSVSNWKEIPVSIFYFLFYLLPGVRIVVCHSVSTDHPFRARASRLNLDNDQLLHRHPGPRYQTHKPKNTPRLRHGAPGVVTRNASEVRKSRAQLGLRRLELVCVSIGWSWENFVTGISSHLTWDPLA